LRLRTYSTTLEDYNALFERRMWDNLSATEKAEFGNVVHLLPTHVAVEECNRDRLTVLPKPVVLCKAKHSCNEAKKASEEDAEGLECEIFLAEGAKVMLTHNLWTSKGEFKLLVNHIIED
jgi:hypothetical protein